MDENQPTLTPVSPSSTKKRGGMGGVIAIALIILILSAGAIYFLVIGGVPLPAGSVNP